MQVNRAPHTPIIEKGIPQKSGFPQTLMVASLLFFSLVLHLVIAATCHGNSIERRELELKEAHLRHAILKKQYEELVTELSEIQADRDRQIKSTKAQIKHLRATQAP